MNTFFKTFFICLVITFSFLCYQFFSHESYNSDLEISKNSQVFGVQKDIAPNDIEKNEEPAEVVNKFETKPDADNKAKPDNKTKKNSYIHKCYFYSNNGQLIEVQRELNSMPTLKNAINLLLKGPLISETKKGIYSEIPANVDLISITESSDSIIINLSSNFGNGGGTQSVLNRVSQLSKTVKKYEPKSDKNAA